MGCRSSSALGAQAAGEDFTIAGSFPAKVVSVYDGDTLRAVFDLRLARGFRARRPHFAQFRVRILGCDCPELRGPADPAARAAAERARERTAQLVGRIVELRAAGFDNFGRLLAEVWVDGGSHAERLVAEGHARRYAPRGKK